MKRSTYKVLLVLLVCLMALASVTQTMANGLETIPVEAMQTFYYMNDPKPYNQYPIMTACPKYDFSPWRNSNTNYSPLAVYSVLGRNIPTSSVITGVGYLNYLLNNPPPPDIPWLVVNRNSQRLNAPIILELFVF